jgi:ankyrin repeat protein
MTMKKYFLIIVCGTFIPLFCMEEPPAKKQRVETEEQKATSSLHKAAQKGDLKVVQELIKSGISVNAENKSGGTALHYAAAQGHRDIVQFLVESGANLDAIGKILGASKATPLYFAAQEKHWDIVHLLVMYGANPNIEANKNKVTGLTPLYLAVEEQNTETVKFLLEHKANPRIIVLLAAHDANSGAPRSQEDRTDALHLAVKLNNRELVKLLLHHQASPNNLNYQLNLSGDLLKSKWVTINLIQRTAFEKGDLEIQRELLAKGAEFSLKDTSSDTAIITSLQKLLPGLSLAAFLNIIDAVKNCLKSEVSSADLDQALKYALAKKNYSIILYLLGKGADPKKALAQLNSIPKDMTEHYNLRTQILRRQPLHVQIVNNPLLCKAITLTRGDSYIPLELDLKISPTNVLLTAIKEGKAIDAAAALKAGANPNATSQQETPVLALAALHDSIDAAVKLVAELLKYKANVPDLLLYFLCKSPDVAERQNIIKMIYVAALQQRVSFSSETKTLCEAVLDGNNA